MRGLRQQRQAAGMSQLQLAIKMGVAQSTVAYWESGDALPKVEQLSQLKEIFGASADTLIWGKPDNNILSSVEEL
nr:MAG TPA: helix-turn-helix domain protein [Caudoviricetes sp.]